MDLQSIYPATNSVPFLGVTVDVTEALSRGDLEFVIPKGKEETASIDELKTFILLTAMATDGTLAADFTETETTFTITELGRAALEMPLYS